MACYVQLDDNDIIVGIVSETTKSSSYASDPDFTLITDDQYRDLMALDQTTQIKKLVDGVIVDAPQVTASDDALREIIRRQRNDLLAASDWTQSPDSPLSDAKKQEWATYRQQLRDLPATADPRNPTWPTKPT